jgi:sugar O-acyltransferase (sialic acid O-acetyltransferase NeuD family)
VKFYIAGAGGFGRETLDALRVAAPASAARSVFVDEHAEAVTTDGIPVVRPGETQSGTYVVAIADPCVRQRLARVLEARGLTPGRVLHPRAVVSPAAVVAPGCVVLANAFVSTGAVLGPHTHINYNATVGHDALLAGFVTVLPGANIAGSVVIGAQVTVGSNACILQGLRLGSGAVVGAGAVVTRSQPDGVVVAGVPARPLGGRGA